jgi:hypothetical protein
LRPIPRILSLQLRECASQNRIAKPSRARWFGVLTRAGKVRALVRVVGHPDTNHFLIM